jgi:hypothetical protein
MLIDSFVPNPDAVEVHQLLINAPQKAVYEALWTADLGGATIKLLLLVRSIPAIVTRRSRLRPRNRKITMQTLIDSGFGLLSESPSEELVLGVTGRFWRPTGNLKPFNRADFDGPVPPGFARAAWNFSLQAESPNRTLLRTETRVVCGDTASRRKFRAYWLLVRPFSGLIRLIMLRRIRMVAEAGR